MRMQDLMSGVSYWQDPGTGTEHVFTIGGKLTLLGGGTTNIDR